MTAPDKYAEKARRIVDDLAQEIRRVDGSNSFGAGALAEALVPFISKALREAEAEGMRRAAEIARKHEKRAAELRLSGGETHDEQVAFRVAYAILAEIEAGGE